MILLSIQCNENCAIIETYTGNANDGSVEAKTANVTKCAKMHKNVAKIRLYLLLIGQEETDYFLLIV